MFKHLLTPLAAASLLCVGCSQLNPFGGDSDENPVASDSWNESSESETAWNQEEGSNPTASNPQSDNYESSANFPLANESENEGSTYGFANAEEASAASPYAFTGNDGSNDPAAELFARVENLQAANARLSDDVSELNQRFGELLAICQTNAKQTNASNALFANASSQIESFGTTLAGFDSQITSIAAETSATRNELREVRTDVRNVSNSTTSNLTPVIENVNNSNGNWFKITLAVLIVGFATLSYFCWKAFNGRNSNNNNAAGY